MSQTTYAILCYQTFNKPFHWANDFYATKTNNGNGNGNNHCTHTIQWNETDAASVMVHVIHGSNIAAMQYGNSSASSLFFHSIFGALFGRNRNTDRIHLKNDNAHRQHNVINTLAIDNGMENGYDGGTMDARVTTMDQQKHQTNKAINEQQWPPILYEMAEKERCRWLSMVHQVYELLSGQLHIIIHTIYKQFPDTLFCWLFHYVVGTVTIHLLLATNSS